jgi:hypothetical protein
VAERFDTDKNNVVRPITEKRSGGGGGAVLATVVALVLGVGGAGGAAVIGGGSGSSATASSARSTQARQRDTTAARIRLEARRLRVTDERFDVTTDCAAHSYGQVRRFFREQPCTALFRASFRARDRRGTVVLVAIAWVEMPDAGSARECHRLVDTHGHGQRHGAASHAATARRW